MDDDIEHGVKKGSGSGSTEGSGGLAILDTTDFPEKRPNSAWKELKQLPFELFETFRWKNMRAQGYPIWRSGDLDAFFTLAGDNLATQLVLISIFSCVDDGVTAGYAIGRVMPGIGLSMMVGNAYYALQASKLSRKTGRIDVCSQPYGICAPGALMKGYMIFLPVFKSNLADSNYKTPNEAFDGALQVTAACNLMSALIEIVGAFILPFVADKLSSAALLTPLAGIGITWLGAHQLQGLVSVDPMVGMLSLAIVWFGTFGGGKLGTTPIVLFAIAIGTTLSWMTRVTRKTEDVIESANLVNISFGVPGVCFQDWSRVLEYMTLLLPISLTNALGSLECVRAAQESGDDYSSVETMLVDGLGSFIGACFGSPVGTTVYLGHPAYKKMGGSRGYGLLNGAVFYVIGITGFHGLLGAIIPSETVYCVIMFVGFMIAAETVDLTPKRWRPAVFLGMMIPAFDWVSMMVNVGSATVLDPAQNFNVAAAGIPCPAASGMNIKITPAPEAGATIGECIGLNYWKTQDLKTNGIYLPGQPGVTLMKNGYLFISLLWTMGFISITDRKMLKAACIWFICSILSVFGVIHANELTIPVEEGGAGKAQRNFIYGYLLMVAFCLIIHLLQRFGLSNAPICRSTVGCEVWDRPKENDSDDVNSELSFQHARRTRVSFDAEI